MDSILKGWIERSLFPEVKESAISGFGPLGHSRGQDQTETMESQVFAANASSPLHLPS
jgi:hypothetical protein